MPVESGVGNTVFILVGADGAEPVGAKQAHPISQAMPFQVADDATSLPAFGGDKMDNRSKLLKLSVHNLGCIGPEGVEIALDDVVCLVGKNNAGKSTILRAYELAQGAAKYDPDKDRCRWAPEGDPTWIELHVHIPKGIANVDEKWKESMGDFLVVRSRWTWSAAGDKSRATFDPVANDWSAEEKAGGADNVFKSRLPKPLRIGSLEDADKTQEILLTLALSPFVTQMNYEQTNPESSLYKTIGALITEVEQLGESHEKRFAEISAAVHDGFSSVFPNLGVRLSVGMSPPNIKLADLLKSGSGLRIKDGDTETTLGQQGTGARRALFWSMLRVHNQITASQDLKDKLTKQLQKEKKEEKIASLRQRLQDLQDGRYQPEEDDPAFPGYLLLIDEPENALHPMAARAAQRHLYGLARDPDWQVIMTTHSPFFVNPLEDHTTIVRLGRANGDKGEIIRRTYRTDSIDFDPETKKNLQAIQNMDANFSEIFFGSYPIVVEGDTEYASFIASVTEKGSELVNHASIIRARGKAIIPAIVRMLRHFAVDFSIVHDIDWPFTSEGKKNGMWTINRAIYDEIVQSRREGLVVNHRCSVPDFERYLGGKALGKDKPLSAYLRIREDGKTREMVAALFENLCNGKGATPFPTADGPADFEVSAGAALAAWCKENGAEGDIRFTGRAGISEASAG